MAGLAGVVVGNLICARYRIMSKLGDGSNGDVYRAHDEHLDKEVAIKLIEPQPGEAATWDEARALEQLRSRYLLPVFNADVVAGSDIRYITAPVMAGGDLEKAASPHGVDSVKAVDWTQQAAYGLERIHAEGMLHRDVKPGNIYLDDSRVLLGDFGMVVRVDARGNAPRQGTIATVAPEVLRGGECSVASDVYSLAATSYYLVTGQYPSGPRSLDLKPRSDRVLAGKFDKLRDVAPHVSQSLAQIIERSMSVDPAQRAASAQEFASQLADCRQHRRAWLRVASHAGHDLCFEGSATKSAKALTLCVLPEGAADVSVEVVLEGGMHAKRYERSGLSRSRLSQTLKAMFRDL
jgi:serine/threonine-protein kinase